MEKYEEYFKILKSIYLIHVILCMKIKYTFSGL
jgi:hypothetical protein